MTITLAQPLQIGNAARFVLRPPVGAARCVLLRKLADNFAGWNDPAAVAVYDGEPVLAVLDWFGLLNGTTYFYRLYSLVAGAWIVSAPRQVVPAAGYKDQAIDVQAIVRERVDLGLQVEVQRGRLQHKSGRIQVLTASPVFEHASWPLVTVHVNSVGAGDRAIGDVMAADVFNVEDDSVSSREGWIARWAIGVNGWSQNADERAELRKAIDRVVRGNFAVFGAAGMMQLEFNQADAEDFERYSAPVHMINGTLTCTAMSLIEVPEATIATVSTTLTP